MKLGTKKLVRRIEKPAWASSKEANLPLCPLSWDTEAPGRASGLSTLWQGSEILGSRGQSRVLWRPGRVLRNESLAYWACFLSLLFLPKLHPLPFFHLLVPGSPAKGCWGAELWCGSKLQISECLQSNSNGGRRGPRTGDLLSIILIATLPCNTYCLSLKAGENEPQLSHQFLSPNPRLAKQYDYTSGSLFWDEDLSLRWAPGLYLAKEDLQ